MCDGWLLVIEHALLDDEFASNTWVVRRSDSAEEQPCCILKVLCDDEPQFVVFGGDREDVTVDRGELLVLPQTLAAVEDV